MISGGLFPALLDDQVFGRSSGGNGSPGRPFVAVMAFREPRPILRRRARDAKKRGLRLPLRRKARPQKTPKAPKPRKFMLVFNRRRGWELPGGGPREGETEQETAAREFLEETGYEAALSERFALHDGSVVFLARLGKRRGMPRDEDIKEIRFLREPPREGLSFPPEELERLLRAAREKGY